MATATLALVAECLPSQMEAVEVNGGKGFDCRFRKGQLAGTPDTDKFFLMQSVLEKLMEKGISKEFVRVQFTFKAPNSDGVVPYPRIYVNTELSPRQQEAKRVDETASAVSRLEAQNALLMAMLTQLHPELVKPQVEVATATVEEAEGPF